jgi:hypothetical protein
MRSNCGKIKRLCGRIISHRLEVEPDVEIGGRMRQGTD